MDRVVIGGCFLLVALGILLGLGFSPNGSTGKNIRDSLEILSFIGTAITAVVAIAALTSWRGQFHYTERYRALKNLKDASVDLLFFVTYLDSVFLHQFETLSIGASPDEQRRAEAEARQNWIAVFDTYNRAWNSAVVFLTAQEAKEFVGTPTVYSKRSSEDAMKIRLAGRTINADDRFISLMEEAEKLTDSARSLYDATRADIDRLIASQRLT